MFRTTLELSVISLVIYHTEIEPRQDTELKT